jgi:hypothetical protein
MMLVPSHFVRIHRIVYSELHTQLQAVQTPQPLHSSLDSSARSKTLLLLLLLQVATDTASAITAI